MKLLIWICWKSMKLGKFFTVIVDTTHVRPSQRRTEGSQRICVGESLGASESLGADLLVNSIRPIQEEKTMEKHPVNDPSVPWFLGVDIKGMGWD